MESNSVCRTCLAKRANRNILELEPQNNLSFEDIMLFCLGIEVQKNPKVSTKICLRCFKQISMFYEFKVQAIKNDDFLTNQVVVKHEDSSDNDSVTSNGADRFDEPLVEDKIYLQKSINIEESKDVLSFESNTIIIPELNGIKVEIKEEGNSDDLAHNEAVGLDEKEIIIKIKSDDVKTKENKPLKKKRGRKKTAKKNTPQVCDVCGKTVMNLKEHYNIHLPPSAKKEFPCKSCDKVFATCSARYKHYQRKHLLIRKTCPVCSKQVSNLKMHTMLVHEPSSLPVACSLCDRRFLSKILMESHLSLHTMDKPFQCDTCEKKFRLRGQLISHIRAVHNQEKSHMCQYCSKRFFKKHHMKMHIRTHTKEKPHECPECGKCFRTSTILKNHRLIHADVRAFACSLCDMTFIRASALNTHMISHTKEKKYPCSFCGFRFGRSDHRRRHEMAHTKMHYKVETPEKT